MFRVSELKEIPLFSEDQPNKLLLVISVHISSPSPFGTRAEEENQDWVEELASDSGFILVCLWRWIYDQGLIIPYR